MSICRFLRAQKERKKTPRELDFLLNTELYMHLDVSTWSYVTGTWLYILTHVWKGKGIELAELQIVDLLIMYDKSENHIV